MMLGLLLAMEAAAALGEQYEIEAAASASARKRGKKAFMDDANMAVLTR